MSTTSSLPSTPAEYAAKVINQTNRHVFLTGKAGTGKTTFLKKIIDQTHKKTVVVAPTGIAAINAGGVTIHSQFQLPFGAFIPVRKTGGILSGAVQVNTPDTLFRRMQMNKNKRNVLRELELLIIDEVSMLRADILDAIDYVLRSVRRTSRPFGGVQVLFIGDLHQLPPVVKGEEWSYLKSYYKSMMFFEAHALKEEKPLYIELDKIYRQNDLEFITLLNNLRNNQLKDSDIDLLNKYFVKDFDIRNNKNTIYLTTHNYKADSKNKQALNSLPGASYFFDAEVKGEFNELSYPVEQNLELKAGAQIMFVKNDPSGEQRFFNGKVATIKSINNKEITVQFEEPWDTLQLEKYEWKNIRYEHNDETGEIEEKVIGSFKQYPVKLAWAITVHKSQGLTFEKAILDINESFAPGQIYVALSRLKSLDGLILINPFKRKQLEQDETLNHFEKIKDKQGDLGEILKKESQEFIKSFLLKAFDFSGIHQLLKEHLESYKTIEGQSNKKKHKEWAKGLVDEFESEKNLSVRFLREIQDIFNGSNEGKLNTLLIRIEKAKSYFTPKLSEYSERIYNHRFEVRKEKKVKTYLKELEETELIFPARIREMNKAVILVESILKNKELTKAHISEALGKINMPQTIRLVKPLSEDEDYEEAVEIKKVNLKNSKQLSYELFIQGISVADIAEKRSMATSTIEGHLAHYIATGDLDIKTVMSEKKAQKIIEVAESMESPALKDIKEKLGDEFSYSDIKFANALKKLRSMELKTNSRDL